MKLIHLISLCLIEPGLQTLLESPVGDFRFAIGLRMPYRSKLPSDAEFLTKLVKSCTTKLATIICDYHFGKTMPANDGFLESLTLASMIWVSGSASIHLVKKSIATGKNLHCLVAWGNGLRMSILHWVKGHHGVAIWFKCAASWCWVTVFLWQWSHFCTNSVSSYCIIGQ